MKIVSNKKWNHMKGYIEELEATELEGEAIKKAAYDVQVQNETLKGLRDDIVLHFNFVIDEKVMRKSIPGVKGLFSISFNKSNQLVISQNEIAEFIIDKGSIKSYWVEFQEIQERIEPSVDFQYTPESTEPEVEEKIILKENATPEQIKTGKEVKVKSIKVLKIPAEEPKEKAE